jgi:hypothetical protein
MEAEGSQHLVKELTESGGTGRNCSDSPELV